MQGVTIPHAPVSGYEAESGGIEAGFMSVVLIFRRSRGGVQRIVETDLLGKGQFLVSAAPGIFQAQPAAIIGAPLAEGAVGTGVFF